MGDSKALSPRRFLTISIDRAKTGLVGNENLPSQIDFARSQEDTSCSHMNMQAKSRVKTQSKWVIHMNRYPVQNNHVYCLAKQCEDHVSLYYTDGLECIYMKSYLYY